MIDSKKKINNKHSSSSDDDSDADSTISSATVLDAKIVESRSGRTNEQFRAM